MFRASSAHLQEDIVVYNYAWCLKHGEENSILWINNSQCIKLVINVQSVIWLFIYICTGLVQGCWEVLSPTMKETSYSDRRFWFSYILFIIIIGGTLAPLYESGDSSGGTVTELPLGWSTNCVSISGKNKKFFSSLKPTNLLFPLSFLCDGYRG